MEKQSEINKLMYTLIIFMSFTFIRIQNCHFVTRDTLYFLIAENRLFRSKEQVERKERILKSLIFLFSVRYDIFYQNVYKFQKRIFGGLKGLLR